MGSCLCCDVCAQLHVAPRPINQTVQFSQLVSLLQLGGVGCLPKRYYMLRRAALKILSVQQYPGTTGATCFVHKEVAMQDEALPFVQKHNMCNLFTFATHMHECTCSYPLTKLQGYITYDNDHIPEQQVVDASVP